METIIQEFIMVVVSMLVVLIIAKLCYDKYKSNRFNEADLQMEHTLKHQK